MPESSETVRLISHSRFLFGDNVACSPLGTRCHALCRTYLQLFVICHRPVSDGAFAIPISSIGTGVIYYRHLCFITRSHATWGWVPRPANGGSGSCAGKNTVTTCPFTALNTVHQTACERVFPKTTSSVHDTTNLALRLLKDWEAILQDPTLTTVFKQKLVNILHTASLFMFTV